MGNREFTERRKDAVRLHAQLTGLSFQQITSDLHQILGREMLSEISGRDVRTVTRWVSGDAAPTLASERLLRNVYQIAAVIERSADADSCRAWFMEMNPLLEEDDPVTALADGRMKQVMGAARTWAQLSQATAA